MTEEDVPKIETEESFSLVVKKICHYIIKTVDAAYSYEQLRTTVAGQSLRPLVIRLSEDCHYPAITAALLYVTWSRSLADS